MNNPLEELKNNLCNHSLSLPFKAVFKYKDNSFLCYQYLNSIVKEKNLNKIFIESLNDLNSISPILQNDNNIYIIEVDKLNSSLDFNCSYNILVICQEIDPKLKIDFIEFPPLVEWQLKDYIKAKLPGLSVENISWLYYITKGDIYKIAEECDKISIFSPSLQNKIFLSLKQERNYENLNVSSIFDLLKAISKRDIESLKNMREEIRQEDPFALITLLNKQFLNIINIQLYKNATPESLKMPYNQFQAIKYLTGYYTSSQLIKIIDFLSSLDYRVKGGELDTSSEYFTYYIINNIINI